MAGFAAYFTPLPVENSLLSAKLLDGTVFVAIKYSPVVAFDALARAFRAERRSADDILRYASVRRRTVNEMWPRIRRVLGFMSDHAALKTTTTLVVVRAG